MRLMLNSRGLNTKTGRLKLLEGTILPHYTSAQAEKYKETSDYSMIGSYNNFYSVDNEHMLCIDV